MESKMLYTSEASFVVLLKKAADIYIDHPTKSTAFHSFNFYCFGEQLLRRL